MPITFIVDVLPGEPNFLASVCRKPVRVINEREEVVFSCPAPVNGWTQSSLELVTVDLTEYPLDAYLGEKWIGSTEV